MQRFSARRYNLWETWIVSINYFSSITECVVLKWSVYLGIYFPDIQNNLFDKRRRQFRFLNIYVLNKIRIKLASIIFSRLACVSLILFFLFFLFFSSLRTTLDYNVFILFKEQHQWRRIANITFIKHLELLQLENCNDARGM